MIRVAVLPVCVLVVSAAIAVAAEPPIAPAPVKTIRLLCVGNSFSQNATRYLRQIMEAGGYQFVLYNAYIGGCPMEKHWQHIVIHEANADDPAGKPFRNPKTGEKIGLKEALAMEPWDFITIQQASIISHDITTYRPYARNLYDYLKQQVPGAEILMHQTWAYRCDDPRFRDGKMTADSMYEQLTTAIARSRRSSAFASFRSAMPSNWRHTTPCGATCRTRRSTPRKRSTPHCPINRAPCTSGTVGRRTMMGHISC